MARINVIRGGATVMSDAGPYVMGGEPDTADTADLFHKNYTTDNDNETAVVDEYFWDAEHTLLAHRSVHLVLKKAPQFAEGDIGKLS